MNPPIRFVVGLHLHQPVGNFDHVFAQHVDDVYRPLLDALEARSFFPVVLHVSGPLLEWLDAHEPAWLDRVAALARAGKIEPLLSGFDEPVLAALPRADRLEQIRRMATAVRARFGVAGTGLWLTERVWEPDLAADLARAGVRYALVDDRHFLVTGFEPEQLHQPWITESDGERVALFPIDERLRYLIPFRPPEETADYLRHLRAQGHRLAVLADDGEKFGGWPGTKEWVYERGWLSRFMDTIHGLIASGEVQLSTFADALEAVPASGPVYLPTASYREMEGWSLPPAAARRLATLEYDLGDRIAGPDGALVRGAHWRNFLAKYSESNQMHKTMLRVSRLCRDRGDPPEPRRAVGRAQCNDAYWHGVFGGLYLPHLREAIWRNLAEAERLLRVGEALAIETLDVDYDGADEILVTSAHFSAVLAPARGGALETFVKFGTGINYADVLTRRHEAYHDDVPHAPSGEQTPHDSMPSIHELEHQHRLNERPPVDRDRRALFVERILPEALPFDAYRNGGYGPVLGAWSQTPMRVESTLTRGEAVISFTAAGGMPLRKTYHFDPRGDVRVVLAWDGARAPEGAVFTSELSLFRPLTVEPDPPLDLWRFPVETVSKSERGLDHTVQGESVTVRWPAALGAGTICLK